MQAFQRFFAKPRRACGWFAWLRGVAEPANFFRNTPAAATWQPRGGILRHATARSERRTLAVDDDLSGRGVLRMHVGLRARSYPEAPKQGRSVASERQRH